jgi:hypothetical protein
LHAIHADRGRLGQSNFYLIIDLAALLWSFANCLPTALPPSYPPIPPRCDSARPVCTTCQRRMISCDYPKERRFRGPGKKTKAQTEKKKKRVSEASRAAADQSTAESGLGSMFERREEEEGMMSGSGRGGGDSGSSTSVSYHFQHQRSLLSSMLPMGSEQHFHHPYTSSLHPIATHQFQRPSYPNIPYPPPSSSASSSSSNIIFPHLHASNQARFQAQTRPDRSHSLSSSLPTQTASYWNQLTRPPVPPARS